MVTWLFKKGMFLTFVVDVVVVDSELQKNLSQGPRQRERGSSAHSPYVYVLSGQKKGYYPRV